METIASQELHSGIETQRCGRWIPHSSRPDNNAGNVFDQMSDDLDSLGYGQRDLDNDDASTRDCFRGKHGVLRRVDANCSDNAGFLKPAPHLESLHWVVSFGVRFSVMAVTDRTFSKFGLPYPGIVDSPRMLENAG
jgi:hypothetical protein